MGVTPGTRPTGAALEAASVAGGPEVAAAAKTAQARRRASRQRTPTAAPEPVDVTPAPAPAPASPGAGPALPTIPVTVSTAANTGGGFLLGVMLWAAGLAYLRGGPAGVKALLRAKFLNQVSA